MQKKSCADVVRESQELIELCLKRMLRQSNVEVSRLNDVSEILKEVKDNLPAVIKENAVQALKDAKWIYSLCKDL